MKIRPVVDDLFHPDGQMPRQTEGRSDGNGKAILHKTMKYTISTLIF